MTSSQEDDWDLDLAPADFDESCLSLSTQDNDPDSPLVPNCAVRPLRLKKICRLSVEEDAKLRALGEKYEKNWVQIAPFFAGKTPAQLKRRWEKLQTPDSKRVRWTHEEDESLLTLYKQMGGAWKAISQHFPGRTPDVVKNHFYSCLKKTLPEPPQPLPRPIVLPSDEAAFSVLAISPPPEVRKPLNSGEKLLRIQSLQGALTSLESLLLGTKVEIKRMEEEVRSRHK